MEQVVVLMSSYNGEEFIREQLDSIIAQKGVRVHILVRDDGSSDSTRSILDEYKTRCDLSWYTGDNLRSAGSFMNLIHNAPESEFYAFADQDDVWDDDKLCTAVKMIKECGTSEKPILYSCPTRLVDKDLNPIGDLKHNRTYTDNFAGSLIGSNATGCTVVFNKCLLEYMKLYHGDHLTMHDSLAHKVCCATGGILVRDTMPRVSYRQHDKNVVGSKKDPILKWKRRINAFFKPTCTRSLFLKDIYDVYAEMMSEEDRKLIYKLTNYKEERFGKIKVIFDRRLQGGCTKMSFNFRMAVLFGTF